MDNRLNSKEYLILDRTFMAFGSLMNGLQGKLANADEKEIEKYIKMAWRIAREFTKEAVEDGLKNSEADKKEFTPSSPIDAKRLLEELE